MRARRAVSKLTHEEATLRRQKAEIEEQLRNAETAKRKLEDRQEQRCQLEKELGAATHEHELYKELAKHLGADYLQRRLLQEAEKTIVFHANRLLDRVSSGTLRLELKAENTLELAGGVKALDLRAYYDKAGLEALPVDALSGGQRLPPRRRAHQRRGHGTSAPDQPPIFRGSGACQPHGVL